MSQPRDPEIEETEEEAPPRLPRGRIFGRWVMADLIRIAMYGSLLVAIIALRKPCADGTAALFESFATPPAPEAGAIEPEPTLRYERLTPEQIRERFEKETGKGSDAGAGAGAGAGTGAGAGAGAGTGAGAGADAGADAGAGAGG